MSIGVAIGGVLVGAVFVASGAAIMLAGGVEGAVLLAAGPLLAVSVLLLHALIVVTTKVETNVNRINNHLLDALDFLRRVEPFVKTIADNSQISEAARSIANREKERETLRQAIREEMYGGDWEAVSHLINEMERRFGYVQEAKTLKADLAEVREMTIEEKIGEAISHITRLMDEHQWERARQESERLMRLFPRHEKVLGLPGELNQRRAARKQELLVQWNAAVAREEVEKGIAILTELDQYLAPEEAESLRESALHVFKTRLVNLGVQFSLAASEGRWRDALEAGLQLRQEFPNSRMAQEVAEKIDTLRVRAGFIANAEIVQRRPPASPG